jgi:hypothetical protein
VWLIGLAVGLGILGVGEVAGKLLVQEGGPWSQGGDVDSRGSYLVVELDFRLPAGEQAEDEAQNEIDFAGEVGGDSDLEDGD